MKFKFAIECLEIRKRSIEDDIAFYQRKNSPGVVQLSAGYRKDRIAECEGEISEILEAINLLKEASS